MCIRDTPPQLLRSECGLDFGNVLTQRIRAHDHLALAAKQGNLGAMDAWFELRKGEAAGGAGEGGDGGGGSGGDGSGGVSTSVDAQRLRGGAGPLHYAVLHGHADAVDWLLAHGADPNLQNDNGATPLHFVATLGPRLARAIRVPSPAADPAEPRQRIHKALLAASANPQIVGRSALWEGERSAAELLYNGFHIDGRVYCFSPLGSELLRGGGPGHSAHMLSRPRLARLGSLLAFGEVEYAPLIEAAREGDEHAVQAWLDAHPSTHPDGPPGYTGTTALAHAASGGSAECVRLLIAAGADVRMPRPPRANALHYSAFKLHRHVATVLAAAPHAAEALSARGNSALWASLGAQTPEELARFNAAQALEFAATLEAPDEAAPRPSA